MGALPSGAAACVEESIECRVCETENEEEFAKGYGDPCVQYSAYPETSGTYWRQVHGDGLDPWEGFSDRLVPPVPLVVAHYASAVAEPSDAARPRAASGLRPPPVMRYSHGEQAPPSWQRSSPAIEQSAYGPSGGVLPPRQKVEDAGYSKTSKVRDFLRDAEDRDGAPRGGALDLPPERLARHSPGRSRPSSAFAVPEGPSSGQASPSPTSWLCMPSAAASLSVPVPLVPFPGQGDFEVDPRDFELPRSRAASPPASVYLPPARTFAAPPPPHVESSSWMDAIAAMASTSSPRGGKVPPASCAVPAGAALARQTDVSPPPPPPRRAHYSEVWSSFPGGAASPPAPASVPAPAARGGNPLSRPASPRSSVIVAAASGSYPLSLSRPSSPRRPPLSPSGSVRVTPASGGGSPGSSVRVLPPRPASAAVAGRRSKSVVVSAFGIGGAEGGSAAVRRQPQSVQSRPASPSPPRWNFSK
mmetsp:Transcript_31980/g.74922  ORF Transcript_31980/g.74922 Transcript_31980/m.74922 type:complete len:474 (+) Transcript_31980:63-1484(+)